MFHVKQCQRIESRRQPIGHTLHVWQPVSVFGGLGRAGAVRENVNDVPGRCAGGGDSEL